MRSSKLIVPLVLSLVLLPLTVRAQQTANNNVNSRPETAPFRIVLSDGSIVDGLVSFTMHLDTQYGKMSVSSSNLLSAKFSNSNQWADLRLKDIQMRVKYNPATSDFAITSSMGPLNINFAKVVLIESPDVQVAAEQPPPQPSVTSTDNQQQPPAAPYDAYADQLQPQYSQAIPYDYSNAATWPIYATSQPAYCYPYGYSSVWCPGYGYITCFRDNHGRIHRAPEGYGRYNNNTGRAYSSSSYRSPTFRSTSSPAFRNAAGSSFRSAAPSFHGSSAPSHSSGGGGGGTQFGYGGGGGGSGGRGR